MPRSSVHAVPSSRPISATIASASSGLSVELPSWSTVSTRTPGALSVEACAPRSPASSRVQPAVVGQPRHRARTRRGACGRSGRGSSRVRRAACACPSISQPSADVSTGSGWVPWLTCGSCCGSPSSSRFSAADATAMVLARLYWPASSTTSRSRLPRGTRPALAKSHAVPPTTQPVMVGDEARRTPSRRSPASRRRRRVVFLATSDASTPAAITSRNRFSTTACDCATTPMRQRFSLTSRAMTAAAVKVLPVPGGPCTARYDESRSSSAAVIDVGDIRACGEAAPPLRVRGGRRSRMSITASAAGWAGPRRCRRRSRRWSRAAAWWGSAGPASARTAAGRNSPPSLGSRSTTVTSVGAARVVAVDDGDRAERPALRVVGEARGRRRLVERVHRLAELAGRDALRGA